jgi:hypothetical protein
MEDETKKVIDKALLEKKTLDQIAKIMLLYGTPEQQKEVLEYVKKVPK